MSGEIEPKLKAALKPIYQEMLANLPDGKFVSFCGQWGKKYHQTANRILVLGKATNGWPNDSRDVNELFDHPTKRIFAKDDQMRWVEDYAHHPEKKYNSNRSAFWRLVKKLSISVHGDEPEWYSYIAWSNLHKCAPDGGNPSMKLVNHLLGYSRDILAKELEILNPHYVICLTSYWENFLLKHLNEGIMPEPNSTIRWGNKRTYESKRFNLAGRTIISSWHPQGKPSDLHLEAIRKLMQAS